VAWGILTLLAFFPPRERELYWSPAESTTALQPKKRHRLVNRINNLQEYLGKQWYRCAAGRPKSTALQPKFTAFSELTLPGHARKPSGPQSNRKTPHFNRNSPHFNRKSTALQPKSDRTSTEHVPHSNRKNTALQPKFPSGLSNRLNGLRIHRVG
jgi:hypothetical protein